MAEKEERQLDGRGLEIVLHVFTHSQWPHFYSSSVDASTFLNFLFPFSPLLFPSPLAPNAVARSLDSSSHCLHLSPLLLFACLCQSVPTRLCWSEPLQWIISQLTHRGQPKPPVQT